MIAFATSILAKATVVTVLALAGTRLARGSRAAVRHVLLAGLFPVLLILPAASIVAPAVRIAVPIAPQAAIVRSAPDTIPEASVPGQPAQAGAVMTPAFRVPRLSPSALLVAGWAAGATMFLVPVFAGLWQVRVLRRSGLPWRDGQAVVNRAKGEAGIRRHVEVLLHASMSGPMTCGAFRPAIVMPSDAETWADDDLRRAIVHELEHVRRGDWPSRCVARVACACYWFHPAVWIAWRRLNLEAERACDDAVLRRAEATAYADQLVVLARRLSGASRPPVLAMANRHDLATRVGAVLDTTQPRGRAGAQWVGLAAAVSALILTAVSPLRLVAVGQTSFQSARAAGNEQRFDAASIRPCQAEEAPPGPARGGMGGTNASFSPGRMNVPCATLEQLIYLAYAGAGAPLDKQLENVVPGGASDDRKVRGGPAWVHSQHSKFAVEATAAGASDRYVLVGTMLQSLLEGRFHLKVHRETEDVPMWAMTVAKGGLKIKPMRPGECAPYDAATFDPNAPKPTCGNLTMGGRGPNVVWKFNGFQLRSLAARLSSALGSYVADRTGVTDEFMLRFEFHPDESTPGIHWPPEREGDTSAPEAASVFTALEQQVGVKLEKTRGPRGYLVIDHVEPLSPGR
ncbi:MAG TPA: M56 family metallopeptidase [Vicinamibacterales bacterium]|jgi:uncharacterized protein (TIGR03435 family)|nr:M56 family metallopeptidase [Vicinamibacterales bacterium]